MREAMNEVESIKMLSALVVGDALEMPPIFGTLDEVGADKVYWTLIEKNALDEVNTELVFDVSWFGVHLKQVQIVYGKDDILGSSEWEKDGVL